MKRYEYAKQIIELFEELNTNYDCERFISDLQKEHLNKIQNTPEKEILAKKVYKEHILVRYYRRTCMDIEVLKRAYKNMDLSSIENEYALKNDFFILNNFIQKVIKYKKIA